MQKYVEIFAPIKEATDLMCVKDYFTPTIEALYQTIKYLHIGQRNLLVPILLKSLNKRFRFAKRNNTLLISIVIDLRFTNDHLNKEGKRIVKEARKEQLPETEPQ